MTLLFPEPVIPRTAALGWVEPRVHWYTESTRPEAAAARRAVNEWYSESRDLDRRFALRLCSEIDVDHQQALDELYVHHRLRQSFSDVRYEEGDVGPDFRVYENGDYMGGVEVVSLFQRADWSAEELRHLRLADELNHRVRPSAGYFVHFEIESATKEPAPRRFAEFVERELARLPAHNTLQFPENPTRADLPQAVFDRDGVRIQVRFVPMRADAPAKLDADARICGTGPMIGGAVNASERLKQRLVAKAGGRYEISDAPFVIAIGVHDLLCSDDQVLDALYGGESVVFDRSRPDDARLERRNDGLFGADRERPEGRHRRVSGVAVVNNLRPGGQPLAEVAVYENPHAARDRPPTLVRPDRRFGIVEQDDSGMRLGWIHGAVDASHE